VAVFWWTSFPSLALPLMKQNGISYFLNKAGNHKTVSIGSISWAITTNLAFFSSTKWVTWLSPNFKTAGGFFLSSFSWLQHQPLVFQPSFAWFLVDSFSIISIKWWLDSFQLSW